MGICGGFCLDLAFLLAGRDDDRGSSPGTLCGQPFGLGTLPGFPGTLAAGVLGQGAVQAQLPQILQHAVLGILAAGAPDDLQFFPPGLHALAQLPACLCKVIALVQPLGHQQTGKGNQLPQLANTIRINGLQGVGLVLPLGFFHGLDLLVNGTGNLLALGLHLLGAL